MEKKVFSKCVTDCLTQNCEAGFLSEPSLTVQQVLNFHSWVFIQSTLLENKRLLALLTVTFSYSRICVCLGHGHQPAAWHWRGRWWVESCEDDRQTAGEPCSTDGLQWRAAHRPFGQRQAGELMSCTDREWRGRFKVGPCSGCLNQGKGVDVCDFLCWAKGVWDVHDRGERWGLSSFMEAPLLLALGNVLWCFW